MSKCRKWLIWLLFVLVACALAAGALVTAMYIMWALMWMKGAIPSPWLPLDMVIRAAELGAALGASCVVVVLLLQRYDDWENGLKVSRTLRRGKWKGYDSKKASPPPGPRPGGR